MTKVATGLSARLLLALVLLVVATSCAGPSRLDRARAGRLIQARLTSRPPLLAVKTTVTLSNTVHERSLTPERWEELLQFLEKNEFYPEVVDQPEFYEPYEPGKIRIVFGGGYGELRVQLPEEARQLDMGTSTTGGGDPLRPFMGGSIADEWHNLRRGDNPEVEVTGITAVREPQEIRYVEFRYRWSTSRAAENMRRRIEDLNSRVAEKFPFLPAPFLELEERGALEGKGSATLILYDDGWRVGEVNIEGLEGEDWSP